MAEQIYFEDVEVGTEISPLVKHPTTVQIAMVSAAKRNLHRIHYDKDFAAKEGHPNVLVHGTLHGAFMATLLTDWIGKQGVLKKISYQNRGRAFPGDTLTCRAKVTNKYVKDGQHYVDLEVWDERQTGEVCTPGTATVILPSRG